MGNNPMVKERMQDDRAINDSEIANKLEKCGAVYKTNLENVIARLSTEQRRL